MVRVAHRDSEFYISYNFPSTVTAARWSLPTATCEIGLLSIIEIGVGEVRFVLNICYSASTRAPPRVLPQASSSPSSEIAAEISLNEEILRMLV